jgi:hypothetical protein
MSALGQKRTWRSCDGMSALPPIADIHRDDQNVRFVPKADISRVTRSRRRREAPTGRKVASVIDRGQLVLCRKRDNKIAVFCYTGQAQLPTMEVPYTSVTGVACPPMMLVARSSASSETQR